MYFLQSAFTQLGIFAGAGNKTTIPNLSRSRLAALKVPQPPKREQQAIVQALRKVRIAVDFHRRKAALLEEMFRYLLRKLMMKEIGVDDL